MGVLYGGEARVDGLRVWPAAAAVSTAAALTLALTLAPVFGLSTAHGCCQAHSHTR